MKATLDKLVQTASASIKAAPSSAPEIDAKLVVADLNSSPRPSEISYQEHPAVESISRTENPVATNDLCPVCENCLAQPLYTIQGFGFRLVACTACGLGRLNPLPQPRQIEDFYPAAYYGAADSKFETLIETLVRWSAMRHADCLTRRLPEGARILDVGCGRGVMLTPLADLGFDVHGFEINEMVASQADPRAKITIASQLSEAGYPANSFDQIILWHVLEHLANPAETLSEIHRLLRPGGSLIVAVPNFGSAQARWSGPHWFHLDLPRHLFHFSTATLSTLLEKNGFAVRSRRHFSLRQNPFGWVQSLLNRNPRQPRNSLYTLLHRRDQSADSPLTWPARLWLRSLLLADDAPRARHQWTHGRTRNRCHGVRLG